MRAHALLPCRAAVFSLQQVIIVSANRTAPRRRVRLLLAAAALLGALSLSACGGSLVGGGPSVGRGHTLESIIEAHGLVMDDPVAALALFKQLGVDRVRVYIAWETVAPDPESRRGPSGFDAANPAAYPAGGWAPYDAIVRVAAADGIGLDLTVGSPPPLWAAGPGAPRHSLDAAEWEPSARDFGLFMHALGERYSGHYRPRGATKPLPRVDFWSIWNEPNYGPYLAPQGIDKGTVEVGSRLYRGLLDAAWSSLAATGHTPATDTILFGETAPRASGPAPGNFNGTLPLRFIRALYCLDGSFKPLRGGAATERGCPATAAGSARFAADNPALFDASGFADHPYPDAEPPTYVTPPPLGTDYADFAALGYLESTLDRAAAAYGRHPRFPIYSTEFGYWTNPPNASALPPVTAAAYLNESEYLSWRNPRIASYDQYQLTDPPPGDGSVFDSGLEFADGQPKPFVYDAYRMPLWLPVTHATSATKRLVVWGCVRPAPVVAQRTHRPQQVAVQFAAAAAAGRAGSFRTLATLTIDTAAGCYFETSERFPGTGTVRLAWRDGGQTFYSRPQAITL